MASAHAKAVIAKEMPGMRIVEDNKTSARPAQPDIISSGVSRPSRSERPYGGDATGSRVRRAARQRSEVIVLEPNVPSADSSRARRITVVIRGDQIITAQG